LLLGTNKEGMTACHLAAEGGHLDTLLNIVESAEKNLTRWEINNKLLLDTDNEGMTAWQLAAFLYI
jgi:ankyrin repeat protein